MARIDPPEFHRVQPDRPPVLIEEAGIPSWPVGGYMPMGFYRSVPIVRFTGTIVLHSLATLVLHDLLFGQPGWVTMAACVVVTLRIVQRAFRLWLGQASPAWKAATLVALALNLLLVSLASLAPGRSDPVVDAAAYPALAPGYRPEPEIRRHFRPRG